MPTGSTKKRILLAHMIENFRAKFIVYETSNKVYQDPILSPPLCSTRMSNIEAIIKQDHDKMDVSNSQDSILFGSITSRNEHLYPRIPEKISLAVIGLLPIPKPITLPREI